MQNSGIKIVSSFITHAVFLILLIGLIVLHRMPFSIYYFQSLYFLFAMSIFSLGLAWLVSALNVFIRDIGNIVTVLIQIGFWATPIFWEVDMMPSSIHKIIELNPMFYIVQGYRDSFIYFIPFWRHPYQSLYFWIVTIIVFSTGAIVFKKLKPQFPDVL